MFLPPFCEIPVIGQQETGFLLTIRYNIRLILKIPADTAASGLHKQVNDDE